MRKIISINTVRTLWAQCGGYCQNPTCNKALFATVGDNVVSIANVAHIIGQGTTGPRRHHDISREVEINGFENLIMLCLECHAVVDKLELLYPPEIMRSWKSTHALKIHNLFSIPNITSERQILLQVDDLLEENKSIFLEYGPFSELALNGQSGDSTLIWRRRCLDTILPNNERVNLLIERNKRHFPAPWDVYTQMLSHKRHTEAFRDNCLLDWKINDYKLFPIEFDHFIKSKLGYSLPPLTQRKGEELELRNGQVKKIIDRFLNYHEQIIKFKQLNDAIFLIDLYDGRTLKVFLTHTYIFTEYSLEKILIMDPSVDAIICTNPTIGYSLSAKELCINAGIGLFMIGEFMGAITKTGKDYLNYLTVSERSNRIERFKKILKNSKPAKGILVYLFGSYLRGKSYSDIDLIIAYSTPESKLSVSALEITIRDEFESNHEILDITVSSLLEIENFDFQNNNLTRVYP